MDTCSVFQPEREKYTRLWREHDDYRTVSFGDQLVGPFLALTGANPGQSLVDVGCGTGRAALKFATLGLDTTMIDLSPLALDSDVRAALDAPELPLDFHEACLWRDWASHIDADYAYCCDVLEHIPIEFTMLVVANCLTAAPTAFLHINFDPDHFGQVIGDTLHLTVKPFVWWRDRLAEIGTLTEARDLLGHGLFLLERP